MALIWLAAERFGFGNFPRGAGSGRRALRVGFACCTRPYWAPRRAPTPSCARTGFRTSTTVRPSLICLDLSQCGRGWGGDGEICSDVCIARGFTGSRTRSRALQCSSEARALWESVVCTYSQAHEHGAVRCNARAKRAHSGRVSCARILRCTFRVSTHSHLADERGSSLT